MVNRKSYFRLEDISKYRSSLMGAAILLVLCHHFTMELPVIRNVSENGFVGVDVFIFLSGLGLYFSYDRINDVKSFYERRFLRIYLPYLLFGIVFSFFFIRDGIIEFLLKVTTIGFWMGDHKTYYEWFVPSIVALYVFYPIVYSIVKAHYSTTLIIVTVLFSTISCFAKVISFPYYFLVGRLPSFILGAYCAKCLVTDKHFKGLSIIALIGFSVAVGSELLVQGDIHIYYWGRTFLLPAMIILICVLFRVFPVLEPIFARLGTFTLEIYLAHLLVLHFDSYVRTNVHMFPDLITAIECVASIVLGWVLSWVASVIVGKYRFVKEKNN